MASASSMTSSSMVGAGAGEGADVTEIGLGEVSFLGSGLAAFSFLTTALLTGISAAAVFFSPTN